MKFLFAVASLRCATIAFATIRNGHIMLSLGDAAKACGKNKSTIQRAIKAGRISARFEEGQYIIDPVELNRVFPILAQHVAQHGKSNNTQPDVQRVQQGGDMVELAVLRAENKLLRDMTDDLRRRLDGAEEDRRRLTALLTHQPEQREAMEGATIGDSSGVSSWLLILLALIIGAAGAYWLIPLALTSATPSY